MNNIIEDNTTVITGMGILCSAGMGIDSFNEALLQGKSNFISSKLFSMLEMPVIMAEFKDYDFSLLLEKISLCSAKQLTTRIKKLGLRAPISLQSSLLVALEAWNQAHLSSRDIHKERIGVVIAGQNISQNYHYNMHPAFKENIKYLPPTYALHFLDTDHVGIISEAFEIEGEGFTIGAASASGNMALIHADRLLRTNLVDVCLVIGPLADLSPIEIQGFYNIGALGGERFAHEPQKACRPFDALHDGFILGQASGCVVLESSALAKKAGIKILGSVAGSAVTLDANHTSAPSLAGEIRVMQRALASAKMAPSDIQYINTHGSSSVLGDQTEIEAISHVFSHDLSHIWLNATKSIVGHGLWSAGIIETIATILQLEHGYLHPTLNLENPIDRNCKFIQSHSIETSICSAMNNSFGFGGMNTCMILNKFLN